jgi:DNA polymerase-3 subunit delta'
MFLGSGANGLIQNTDILGDLRRFAESADFEWIAMAADRLAEVERGMRRNLLRSLSLDGFGLALEKNR